MLRKNYDKLNQDNDETYKIIEVIIGGSFHSGKFEHTNIPQKTDGESDCFHSVYTHTNNIIQYYHTHLNEKGENTIKDYKGSVAARELIIDFDIKEEEKQEDLIQLLDDLRVILRNLQNKYGVDLSAIKINFSGKKGFHIRIPAELFGGFSPSEHLPQLTKRIALQLTTGFIIDTSIYTTIFFIRYINSKNSKSGLCAIPLTANEIFSMNIEDIKQMAKEPRQLEYTVKSKDLIPFPKLVQLKEQTLNSDKDKFRFDLRNIKISDDDRFWNGVAAGSRNETLAKIVGYLIAKRVDENKILAVAKLWNNHCKPPEKESLVIDHVLSMIKDFATSHEGFWFTNSKNNIQFSRVDYRKFLEETGFAKFWVGKEYMFVRVTNKKITEVSTENIKDYVLKFIRSQGNPNSEKVEEALLQKENLSLMEENVLECISNIETKLVRDTSERAHFYFSNCFVDVTKDEINSRDYNELDGYVWESQINHKEFFVDVETRSDFEKFVFNISGKDNDRFRAFQSAIGYLLHSYKDSSNAKAIVFCDQKISDNPEGRTGKSLLGNAIGKLLKTTKIDGKNFEFRPQFTFQQADIDTKILNFNDVKKNFSFESLFSVITDDMWIENKRQRPFIIPFEKSPKILVSTNYVMRGQGSSYKARMFEIEFSDYYSESHTPAQDFGRQFFDEWDQTEWNRFYNFMLRCVQLYLKEGLLEPVNKNLQLRKIYDATTKDFVDFIEDQDLTQKMEKKIIYKTFVTKCPDFLHIKQNTFSKWIKIYCSVKGYSLNESRSDGKDFITIKVQ